MKIKEPVKGKKITIKENSLIIPDIIQIPFIQGDGIGADITKATLPVIDAAVKKAYNNCKKIIWFEIYAGEKALKFYNNVMPKETLKLIEKYKILLKGPLTTPVGGGYRSLNVFLRQNFDLYACIRPVKYYKGVPSPVLHPEYMDVVIFRENTEDVYAGIEWQKDTKEVKELITILKEKFNVSIRSDSGIGIKPISESSSKRLVRMAIEYAIKNKRKKVTLMHKGNIMKFTEGAFKNWGYETAENEFSDIIITEKKLYDKHNGKIPKGKIVINDRIADSMFQQILTRAEEYDVIATTNLNGDYISDACAAQVGGLGMAPGANVGDTIAIFEATHGSAPKYTNQDKVNPSSLILSSKLMLEYLGWNEAAKLIETGIQKAIKQKKVTYDLARLMKNAIEIKCSEFTQQIINNIIK